MSYIFNATVLARQIYVWGETPAGQLTSIRHPSTVFLFADGKPAVDNDFRGYSVSAAFAPQETMSASFNYYRRQYDLQRHRGKMNVVFVDGHAETLQMPVLDVEAGEWRQTSDFENVGVSLGIFD